MRNRSLGASLEAGRGGARARRAALRARGTLRPLPRPPQGTADERGVVLEGPQESSEGPSARATRRALWYLATSLKDAKSAACWYWQRGWIEQSFKDAKSRFGLARVRVGTPERLSRLLMALSVALSWLTLMGLPEGGVVPRGFRSPVAAWGRASVISTALALLEDLGNIPLRCLPQPRVTR